MLSMGAVTRPVAPMTPSTLVRVIFGVKYFLAKGRRLASSTMDTPKNSTICSQSSAPHSAAISAARAPAPNHRETIVTVVVSIHKNRTISTSQTILSIPKPPFACYKYSIPKICPLVNWLCAKIFCNRKALRAFLKKSTNFKTNVL